MVQGTGTGSDMDINMRGTLMTEGCLVIDVDVIRDFGRAGDAVRTPTHQHGNAPRSGYQSRSGVCAAAVVLGELWLLDQASS